ncbi:MAG: glycosyl hydrolase family 3 [Gammaproteobacteria bacterium]|nr:glycosyl hydrolase family 3 [Gammaproteobacteria bacterium]
MKKFFLLVFFNSFITAEVDWASSNNCELPNNSNFINSLISKMTLEQKVGQIIMPEINNITIEEVKQYQFGTVLNGGGGFPNQNKNSSIEDWKTLSKGYFDVSPIVNEIRIPILWGTDAVHGHNNVIGATIFPHNIGLGATRNTLLVKEIGSAVAKEVASTGIVWTFAPTIAVPKNDLWGRAYEGYSENTDLVSELGKNFIIGLQGYGDEFLDNNHILATAKHFLGDGGTENGIDQGDTIMNELSLKEIHGSPYYDAINSCVLSIMASFNSWNGIKMHGNKYLLTDVLKSQMEFNGFVVGDWNGHGQIPGCEDNNCPEALIAGVDIYMVPTEWKALYWNTLDQVKTGIIPIERLNDAVYRILNVKDHLGLFDKRVPHNYQNNFLSNKNHRSLARQAVRESVVLLKNNNSLPMNPSKKFLVIGDMSRHIENQMGGWTITWQGQSWEGTNISNDDFPNTNSIFDSLSNHILSLGGDVEYSENGSYKNEPDYIIFVYGETPYAEGEGDLKDLNFSKNNEEILRIMKRFQKKDIPLISMFISGRPMIVDQELDYSDAFVSIWLPGTAVEGINDVIFSNIDGTLNYDFIGQLSFSWPSKDSNNPLNKNDSDYSPLFHYGYGLTYKDKNE